MGTGEGREGAQRERESGELAERKLKSAMKRKSVQ